MFTSIASQMYYGNCSWKFQKIHNCSKYWLCPPDDWQSGNAEAFIGRTCLRKRETDVGRDAYRAANAATCRRTIKLRTSSGSSRSRVDSIAWLNGQCGQGSCGEGTILCRCAWLGGTLALPFSLERDFLSATGSSLVRKRAASPKLQVAFVTHRARDAVRLSLGI